MGEAELRQLFEQKGSVESVTVMRDTDTGRSRGFAFVEMSSDEPAQKAIKELNGFSLEGRNLTVNEARPKPARRGEASTGVSVAIGGMNVGEMLSGSRIQSTPLIGRLRSTDRECGVASEP